MTYIEIRTYSFFVPNYTGSKRNKLTPEIFNSTRRDEAHLSETCDKVLQIARMYIYICVCVQTKQWDTEFPQRHATTRKRNFAISADSR